MTLTDKQMAQIDEFASAVRWALDPDLQLSQVNRERVREWVDGDSDLQLILTLGSALQTEIIHPWLRERNAPSATGYLGNINGGHCDPDTA